MPQDASTPVELAPIAVAGYSLPQREKSTNRNLDLLTTLRYFAAAWVFFDHFGKDIFASAPFFMTCMLPYGPMAVTFFFILSGFVLAYSNSVNGHLVKTAKEFLVARFARIYPVYFFALLIPLPHKLFVRQDPGEYFGLPLVLTLTQSWYPPLSSVWNPPAWSLSVEAFFYLSFPLLLKVFCGFKPWRLLAGSVALLAAGEFFRAIVLGYNPQFGRAFPPLNLPQFIYGMALGLCFLNMKKMPPGGTFMFVMGIFFLYFSVYFYAGSNSFVLLPVIALVFGLIIFAAAVLSGRSMMFLQLPLFVLLGEASYAFYIIHMPAMVGFQRALGLVGVKGPEHSLVVLLLGFVFCTIFSVVVHKFLELPAKRWIVQCSKKSVLQPAV